MQKEFTQSGDMIIYAPMTGKVVPIEDVPDQVFAEKMLGDGIAILPTTNQVVAPCDAIIGHVLPTNHAIGLKIGSIDLLIHVGIDQVTMKGEGFKCFVQVGEEVKKGDLLLEIDLERIRKEEKQMITPIIITTMDDISIKKECVNEVIAGESIIYKVEINI